MPKNKSRCNDFSSDGLWPGMRNVFRSFREMLRESTGVVLAVSGGSDSLGLLYLAGFLRDTPCVVGFVDHGLRTGTLTEWEHVRACAEQLCIPSCRLVVSAPPTCDDRRNSGIQQWARQQRYRLLEELASNRGMSHVATAHTMEDQAETVLIRILRGAGIDGIGGIPPVRLTSLEIQLIRPFLTMSRADIRDALLSIPWNWIEDPSNDDFRFQRTSVRRELLPVLTGLQPAVVRNLCELAREARDASLFCNQQVATETAIQPIRLGSGVKVAHDLFAELPVTMQTRLIRRAVHAVRGDLRRIERQHIDAVQRGIARKRGTSQYPFPEPTEIYTSYGDLYVFPCRMDTPSGSDMANSIEVLIPSAHSVLLGPVLNVAARVMMPPFGMSISLCLRPGKRGDRLCGRRTGLQKLLNDNRVPSLYRTRVPVLADADGQILAVPGLWQWKPAEWKIDWEFHPECVLRDLQVFHDVVRSSVK